MGPEDKHEEQPDRDGYEKWLEERANARLAAIIKQSYSQASELDADGWDAEHRRKKRAGSSQEGK